MTGLGLALAAFLVLAAAGVADSRAGETLLIFVQFLGLFAAGYVAGRFSRHTPVLDSGLSGLLAAFISLTISVAGGASLGFGTILLLSAVAAILGSAGGVLALRRRRSPEPGGRTPPATG